MIKKIFKKENFIFLAMIFIFGLFFYITIKTPLAGDDWGFYLNAQHKSPLVLAFEFYFSFSGRFFSEFWEHLGSGNRLIWNFLNPSLFTIIILMLYKITKVKKQHFLIILSLMAMMLSVDDNLRMETYSWLTGEIYIIPLMMALVYFYFIEQILNHKIRHKIIYMLCAFLCFYIGLTVENIAATMIVANLVLFLYAYKILKRNYVLILICLFLSVVFFSVMRLSPGSAIRLYRDHLAWSNLSLLAKFLDGYPNFIEFTFIRNNYLVLFLAVSVILSSLYGHKKIALKYQIILILSNLIAVFAVFSFVFKWDYNPLILKTSWFSLIYWPIYTLIILIYLFNYFNQEKRNKVLFFYVMAGICNATMIFSPIFGSRSSIYTIYFLMIVITMLIDTINFNSYLTMGALIILMVILFDRSYEYYFKYNLVGIVYKERLEIIKYYQKHPEDTEVWIPRYPPFTIHGGDIEKGDTYHFETFKEFYNLPQSSDNIIFYFKESYE